MDTGVAGSSSEDGGSTTSRLLWMADSGGGGLLQHGQDERVVSFFKGVVSPTVANQRLL